MDDFGLFANGRRILEEVKARLSSAFTVKDIGEMKFCLGLEIVRDRERRALSLSQRPYISSLATKYHMENPSPLTIPLDPSLILRKLLDRHFGVP